MALVDKDGKPFHPTINLVEGVNYKRMADMLAKSLEDNPLFRALKKTPTAVAEEVTGKKFREEKTLKFKIGEF